MASGSLLDIRVVDPITEITLGETSKWSPTVDVLHVKEKAFRLYSFVFSPLAIKSYHLDVKAKHTMSFHDIFIDAPLIIYCTANWSCQNDARISIVNTMQI